MKALVQKYFLHILFFFIILVLVLSSFLVYNYFFNRKNLENEVNYLVDKVGDLMFLPIGEIPTIATVSEPEKLKNQEFFKDAKKGDKVLIYTNARKAILYDPLADKIITIAPVSLDKNANTEVENSFQF